MTQVITQQKSPKRIRNFIDGSFLLGIDGNRLLVRTTILPSAPPGKIAKE